MDFSPSQPSCAAPMTMLRHRRLRAGRIRRGVVLPHDAAGAVVENLSGGKGLGDGELPTLRFAVSEFRGPRSTGRSGRTLGEGGVASWHPKQQV